MEVTFRAKIKSINAKDNGTVIQLEPQASYAKQIVELMPKVGMYALITVEDEQQAIPLDCEAEYEQPIEGQTEIEVDGEEEDIFEPVVMSLPEPALPEGEEE